MQHRGGRVATTAKGTETKRLMTAAQRNLESAVEAEEKARRLRARQQGLDAAELEHKRAGMQLTLQQGRAKAREHEQERDKVQQEHLDKKEFYTSLEARTTAMFQQRMDRQDALAELLERKKANQGHREATLKENVEKKRRILEMRQRMKQLKGRNEEYCPCYEKELLN